MYKYKKTFEKLDTFIDGNNTVDYWEWYFSTKFKEHNEHMNCGRKDYFEELQRLYTEFLQSKESSEKNLNNENFYRRHSAIGLLNQLQAIENIFVDNGKDLIK